MAPSKLAVAVALVATLLLLSNSNSKVTKWIQLKHAFLLPSLVLL
jgi:hypothetical protein